MMFVTAVVSSRTPTTMPSANTTPAIADDQLTRSALRCSQLSRADGRLFPDRVESLVGWVRRCRQPADLSEGGG